MRLIKNTLLTLAIAALSCNAAHAQDVTLRDAAHADSVMHVLRSTDDTRIQLGAIWSLTDFYKYSNTELADSLARAGLALAASSEDLSMVDRLLNLLGIIQCVRGKLDSGAYYLEEAAKIAKERHDTARSIATNINLANALQMAGRYDRVISILFENMRYGEVFKMSNVDRARTAGTLASVYAATYEIANALHYDSIALQAISLDHSANARRMENTMMGNHANRLIRIGNYSGAEVLLKRVLASDAYSDQNFLRGNNYVALAKAQEKMKRFDEAEENLRHALKLFRSIKGTSPVSQTWAHLARVKTAKHQFDSAKILALRAINLGREEEDWWSIEVASLLLMQLSALQGDVKGMQHYSELFSVSRDSVQNIQQMGLATGWRTRYETAQKEKENELLRKDKALAQATLDKQRLVIGLGIAVVASMFILLAVVIRANRRQQAANALLERKSQEIEDQKKEILAKNEHLEQALLQLNDTQSQLIQSEKMASLGQFTAGIAHEINNPINFVLGGVQGLKQQLNGVILRDTEMKRMIDASSPALRESIEDIQLLTDTIERGAERTAKIIHGLMRFSHKSNLQMEKANVHELFEAALIILNHDLRDRITVHKHYADLPLIECNVTEMNQVFLNIIANAAQAIKGEGSITLHTYRKDEWNIGIDITDTGEGIAPEIQSKIFDPFFTTKEVGKGTGLGLAITYKIVEKHQGRIVVKSQPSQGATFSVTLPVQQQVSDAITVH